jgi:hypothetical protein
MPTSPDSTFGEVFSCHFFIDTDLSHFDAGSMLGGSSKDDVGGNGGCTYCGRVGTRPSSSSFSICRFRSIPKLHLDKCVRMTAMNN